MEKLKQIQDKLKVALEMSYLAERRNPIEIPLRQIQLEIKEVDAIIESLQYSLKGGR